MKKRIISFLLASAAAFSQLLTAVPVFARDIPQDKLEQLKEELQLEIDRYELRPTINEISEKITAEMNGLSQGISLGSMQASAYTADNLNAADGDYGFTADEAQCDQYGHASAADRNDNTFTAEDFTAAESWSNGAAASSSWNTEEYNPVTPNTFTKVSLDPLSTFSADVDTGSYCNLRRLISQGYSACEIPSGAVRTEELLNYFDYTVEHLSDANFSVQYETSDCPWDSENELLLLTIQANETDHNSAGNNFVFLIDTSGSMNCAEKIALAKCSLKLLAYTLDENDTVSIITYSGDSYTALDGASGSDYDKICEVLDSITPYGGTNGSGGIEAAYRKAEKYFIDGGCNRVIIASDGDMNLGITSQAGLTDLIKKEKESGIFLTVLGFGSGNYSDANMEAIADAGNGNYYYIDCLDEAQHILIEKQKEITLTTAKDVKFQAEFNPVMVSEYRLLGYENRSVSDSDFQNDAVDGGEIGAGQQVTILYEIRRTAEDDESTASLKYQNPGTLTDNAERGELLTLSIDYKEPSASISSVERYAVSETAGDTSSDFYLACSLAELSLILHGELGTERFPQALNLAESAVSSGADLYRMGYTYMLEQLFENS